METEEVTDEELEDEESGVSWCFFSVVLHCFDWHEGSAWCGFPPFPPLPQMWRRVRKRTSGNLWMQRSSVASFLIWKIVCEMIGASFFFL